MQIGAVPMVLVEEGRQQALDPQSSQPPQHTFAPSLFFADFQPEINLRKKVRF
jgi:hypothetical protein